VHFTFLYNTYCDTDKEANRISGEEHFGLSLIWNMTKVSG